jgi:hypothetical protein
MQLGGHDIIKHYGTRIQSKPSRMYQEEDVIQSEGKLNPEGENCSML